MMMFIVALAILHVGLEVVCDTLFTILYHYASDASLHDWICGS